MKALIFFIIALLEIMFLNSCKKDSTSSNPKQNCKIDSITFDIQPLKFLYNSDGTISSIIKGVGGGDTIYFTYGTNTMVQSNGNYIKTNQLSSSGQVLKTNYSLYGTIFWEEDYEYDSHDNLVKVTSVANGIPGDIITCTWENGNMVSATLNGQETETFTYYADKTYQDGDITNLYRLFDSESILHSVDFYHTNKNLLRSEVDVNAGVDLNYSYLFDSKGKIIKITITENTGGNSPSLQLQYKCS